MPRRSLQEDVLLVGALHLHLETGLWGSADLPETVELITGGEEVAAHVAARALRKYKQHNWVSVKPDPDTSLGPRLLYQLTEDQGVPMALTAAGRELANGKLYPIPILSAFGQTAFGQQLLTQDRVNP